MAKYKNLILLVLMLVMAIFIAGVVSSVTNGVIEQDNEEIAAETSGVVLHVMQRTPGQEGLIVNMVNSSQYMIDCLSGEFLLERYDKQEEVWQQEDGVKLVADTESGYDLPSGQNRSFWIYAQNASGEIIENFWSTHSEDTYRICKTIYRDMEKDSRYENLTIRAELTWKTVPEHAAAYGKAVDTAEVASKLARTLLSEQTNMVDYWKPEVEKISSEELNRYMEHNPYETEGLGTSDSYWAVSFPVNQTASDVLTWIMFVDTADGMVYGPVRSNSMSN